LSSLESSKNLAGIGAILLLFSFVPFGGWVIGIIGIILLLMGIKGISGYYQDPAIYQNALSGAVLYVIALIASAVSLGGLSLSGVFSAATLGGLFGIGVGIFLFIVALVVAFIFLVLAATRIRRCLTRIGQHSGVHLFETAGLLFFIGAILTIVFVGLALIVVAWILALIAFFSIRVPYAQPPYTPPPPATQPPSQATRYCPYCGAPVDKTATFCPNCGRQLPPA
jgi:uncharacterized membrane protein